MARRRGAEKRQISGDYKYSDVRVQKLINMLMRGGKKLLAETIVYNAFDAVQEKTGEDPLRLFFSAYENIRPSVEVKSRRVGGASYAVPVELRPERSSFLALRWLIQCARTRSERTMVERLAAETVEAAQKRGGAVKRREEVDKTAEANRAFAHFRW